MIKFYENKIILLFISFLVDGVFWLIVWEFDFGVLKFGV